MSAYAKLAILTAVILFEPQWPETPTQPGAGHVGETDGHAADRSHLAPVTPRAPSREVPRAIWFACFV